MLDHLQAEALVSVGHTLNTVGAEIKQDIDKLTEGR